MAFAYVLDPTNQYQNRAGVNNVHGYFKVYLSNTDDIAVTYKDFNGTLNPERIEIDNNGRAVIIADSSRPYRVEMYEPNGTLVFTQYPVWCVASGGGMTMVDIQSTDGSVSVQKTSSGGMTTYDLSTNPEDDPAFLDWIKCSWYDLVDGAYVPRYASGTMSVGARGVVLSAGMHYHITATVRANKSGATPFYDNIGVHFSLFDGENTVGVQDFIRIVDHSLGLSQDFQVDADIHVGSIDSQLVVSIDGAMEGVTFNLVSLDAHRVYSGVPKIPDGVARQDWVNQNFQKKLVAGENITIDPVTNTISADTSAEQVQSDWTEQDTESPAYIKHKPIIPAAQVQSDWGQANTQAVDYIKNKPSLATVATSGSYNDLSDKPDIPSQQKQSNWTEQDSSDPSFIKNKPNLATVATSGSYNDLSDKPDIPSQQVQSDWTEQDSSDPSFIKNKPNLASVATSGSYDDLSNKPSIPAAQVQSDWSQSDNTQVDYIKNKPSLAAVATSGSYNDLSDKPSIPAPQEQSDWTESDSSDPAYIKNKPNLATVATSGDYDDLSNKPTIPVVPQMKNLVAGQNVSITEDANGVTISASGAPQQQADWSQTDPQAVDYIKNKPSIPAAPVQSNWNESDSSSLAYIQNKPSLASVATSGDYDDLSNKPTIPAAQVQSDWSQSDNTQVDYIKNKPSLATVATSGDYDDLSNKPSIPAAQVQSDWSQSDNTQVDYIKNKPSLAAVATSGDYDDLSNKPSIPAAQVQSDWSQSDNTQVDYIKNKPSLASVATSGSYNDLSDKPTIPAAQVQSDWNEADSSSKAYIQNKPSLASVATSGDYADLSNKPSIPAAPVQSNWNESDSSSLAYIQNKPTIPAAQVQSDWNQSNSQSVDYIKNKPAIPGVEVTNDSFTLTDSSNDEIEVDFTPTIVTQSDLHVSNVNATAIDGTVAITSIQLASAWNFPVGTKVRLVLHKDIVTYGNPFVQIAPGPTQADIGTNISGSLPYDSSTFKMLAGTYEFITTATASDLYFNLFTVGPNASLTALDPGDLDVYVNPVDSRKAIIPEAQVQSDWAQSDSTAVDFIKNKPTIPQGVPAYDSTDENKVLGVVDNQGTPALDWVNPGAVSQVQADWTEQDSSDPSYIQNKPTLATVATSGSYNDLSDKPTIPSGGMLIYRGSANAAFSSKFDNGQTATVSASFPSGYTFLCWIGCSDPTYQGDVSFANRTAASTTAKVCYSGGSTTKRTVACIFLAFKNV